MANEHIEIQPADPRARRRVMIFMVVAIVVVLWGIVEIEEWLDGLHRPGTDLEIAAASAGVLLRVMDGVISLSLAGLGLIVARLSLRVLRAERYPAPGSHVLVDTPVVVGVPARRRAYVGFVLAASLAALGMILPFLLWRALYALSSLAAPP